MDAAVACPLCATTDAGWFRVQKLRRSRSCSIFLTGSRCPLMQVVVVPQVQFCGYGRCCDHAVTSCLANSEGASDSVHRRSWWTFQFATETGTLSAGYGGGMGFSPTLTHFSCSSRSSGIERQFLSPPMVKSSLPLIAPLHNSSDFVDIDIVPSWSRQKQQQH